MKVVNYTVFGVFLGLSLHAFAATPYYIYIDGIQGNESPPAPTGWLKADAFSFELARDASGRLTEHNGLLITKPIDKASPILSRWICEGHTASTIKLNLFSSSSAIRFYEIQLNQATLQNLNVQSAGQETPLERLLIEYDEIIWSYTQLDATETPIGRTDSHWDRATGTGTSESNPDLDGDGMSYNYENAYGLNPALNDAHEDKDGDGLTNIQEMYAGTRPDSPTSVLRVTGIYPTTSALPNTEITWQSVAGKSYDLLYATQADGPYAVIDSVIATGSSTTNSVAIPDPNAYYRVRVHAD